MLIQFVPQNDIILIVILLVFLTICEMIRENYEIINNFFKMEQTNRVTNYLVYANCISEKLIMMYRKFLVKHILQF